MKRNTMDPKTYGYWRGFQEQRSGAKKRGIEWKLSWEEWLQWWMNTGHIDERGRNKGQYQMCRVGDIGPYALDNIYCATLEDNASLPGQRQKGIPKAYKVWNVGVGRAVRVNGVEYPAVSEASKALRMSRTTIRWRVEHQTPGYEWA